ncbi:MAG: hypothetical protein EXX96DRAFT_648628 [Benjaminiella poitrasii]|nr:MAG: hypothetical protein EXX96DRAFT_648628 [Benjaminiella poitrasii]
MTYIKPDPEMQEQDDLIMSYLNTEYISSSPSSTTSSELTGGSPGKQTVDVDDDFMLDSSLLTQPLQPFQHQQPLQDAYYYYPFCWPNTTTATTTLNQQDLLFNPTTNCLQQQQQSDPILSVMPSIFPPSPPLPAPSLTNSNPTNNNANSESEQPKKKRGRKKRESPPAPNLTGNGTGISTTATATLLAPKPLAPRPLISAALTPTTTTTTATTTTATMDSTTVIKTEPIVVPLVLTSKSSEKDEDAQKAAQIQKRQERLIKNRAAALLSRKRKREHLTQLEEEKQALLTENENLKSHVHSLETKIESLEKENLELREKLKEKDTEPAATTTTTTVIQIGHHHHYKKQDALLQKPTTKATGVVFMIILFSFALFTLPTRTTVNRLTVGGSPLEDKQQFPMIDSRPSMASSSPDPEAPATGLVLLDAVQPRDLQTWINHKLVVDPSLTTTTSSSWEEEEEEEEEEYASDHVYLYSKEFSQLASLTNINNEDDNKQQRRHHHHQLPTISLLSPYYHHNNNHSQTTLIDHKEQDQEQCYLQIDVQVLRSNVIKGQLMSLQQFGPPSSRALLLDGMKKDLIIPSPKKRAMMKREKRNMNNNSKRISRILV